MTTYPYVPDRPPVAETADELRARIPGWGADLDPADRPAVPQERYDPSATGAHWVLPDRQPEHRPRERSIEHAMLTPVFGTAQPLSGLSGAVRRLAYQRYSEGRAAHWLLLIAADRVDVVESVGRSLVSRRPDNPLVETGLRTELTHGELRSRAGRADAHHQWMDPIIVAGPWVAGAWLGGRVARAVLRRR